MSEIIKVYMPDNSVKNFEVKGWNYGIGGRRYPAIDLPDHTLLETVSGDWYAMEQPDDHR